MPGKGRGFAFDPVAVGRSECDAWVAYYRRDWLRMLAGALGMVRHGFALGPFGNLKAAWHVMRANQAWAPYPDNDPEAAQRRMARFYRMTSKAGRLSIDPKIAAELEVAWWRMHRERQHDPNVDEATLVASLVRLYCYVYQATPHAVRGAAELRVRAMELSDAWVAAGCRRRPGPGPRATGAGCLIHCLAGSQRSWRPGTSPHAPVAPSQLSS
jgi:hypothetical protein